MNGTQDTERARDRRRTVMVMLTGSLALNALLAVFLGLSYRREGRLHSSLVEANNTIDRARSNVEQAERALASRSEVEQSLHLWTATQGEELSELREKGREARKEVRQSEREIGDLLRTSEGKSEELIRRHHRITELQEELERLTAEMSLAATVAREREMRLRARYEARIRTETSRREELEHQLTALDEITALRDRLRMLVDALEEAVQSE